MNPNPHESPGNPQKSGEPIVLACPACGHLLRLSYQHLGIKGNCVSCKSEIMGAEISPGKFKAVYANQPDNKPVVLEAELVDSKPAEIQPAPKPAPTPEPAPKPEAKPEVPESTFGGFGVSDVEGIDEVEPVGGSFFTAKGSPETKETKPTPPPNPDNEAPSFFTQGAAIESGKAKENPTPAEDEAAQKSWGFSEAVSRKDQNPSDIEAEQPAKPAANSPFPTSGQSQPQNNRFAIKEQEHSSLPAEKPAPAPAPTPEPEPIPAPVSQPAPAATAEPPASPAPAEEPPANPFSFSKEAKPKQPEPQKNAEMERPPFAPISSSVGTAGKQESPFKASTNQPSPFSKPEEPKSEPVAQNPFPTEAPPSFLPETPAPEAAPPQPQPEPAQPKAEQPTAAKETFATPQPQGDPNSPFAGNQFESTTPPPREEAFPTEEPVAEMKSPFEQEESEDNADILRNFLNESPSPSQPTEQPVADPAQPESGVNSQPEPDPINFSNIKLKSTNTRKFQLGTTGIIALLLVFSLVGGAATYLFTPETKKQEFKTQLAEWLAPGAVIIEKLPFGLGENLTPPPQQLTTPKAMEINPSALALPIGPDIKSTASPALPAND